MQKWNQPVGINPHFCDWGLLPLVSVWMSEAKYCLSPPLPHIDVCPLSPSRHSDCSLRNNINEQKVLFYLGYLQMVPKALRIPGEPVNAASFLWKWKKL